MSLVWARVRECHPTGRLAQMANPFRTRRGFWTFAVLTWAFAILVGVVGVGLAVHASLEGFVFVAFFLTVVVALWCWVFRRLSR